MNWPFLGLALFTLLIKTGVYSRLIERCDEMQANLEYPDRWEGLARRGMNPPWRRALEFMFYGCAPAAALDWAARPWGYAVLCLLRLPMWYLRFTTGNDVWWVGPSTRQGKVIAFDMTGDPRPPHLRRHALRATVLSLVLDLPWLVACRLYDGPIPLLA